MPIGTSVTCDSPPPAGRMPTIYLITRFLFQKFVYWGINPRTAHAPRLDTYYSIHRK